ncbi:hypothetical protein CgunFtcFv8_003469 [Champsocephalus gunnari]|uniref:Uncharacterized protein n=1 Tax=Champsocephalus gunnari TaxID=52237 RepID=A0AAN8D9F3_CHAGU|nr:hypothetical protein CgunFtcFv8_003469 [Champsocephalus gunnari]
MMGFTCQSAVGRQLDRRQNDRATANLIGEGDRDGDGWREGGRWQESWGWGGVCRRHRDSERMRWIEEEGKWSETELDIKQLPDNIDSSHGSVQIFKSLLMEGCRLHHNETIFIFG